MGRARIAQSTAYLERPRAGPMTGAVVHAILGVMKRPVTPLDSHPAAATDHRLTASRADVIAITRRIRANLDQAARTFWDIGNDLAHIRRGRLYEVLSYASFNAYVTGELRVKVRQVQKMLAIAHTYVRDDAARVGGIERGTALIAYCRQLPGRPDPGELVRADAAVAGKPLSECDTGDIVAATQELKTARSLKRAQSPAARQEARARENVQKTVRAYLRRANLGRAQVTVEGDEIILRFARGALMERLRDDA